MESFATPYACYFHDGDQEIDKGCIGVHSVLSFKRFQALVAAKTGHPASSLSAVLVCTRTTGDTSKRQKLPINENTNFNIILNQHNPSRERDAHFLISLKKSKKERKVGNAKKRLTEAEGGEDDDTTSSRGDVSPPEERPRPSLSSAEAVSPTPTASSLRSPQPVPSPVSVLPGPNIRLNGPAIKSSAVGSLESKLDKVAAGAGAKKEVPASMTDSTPAVSPVKSSWQSPGILRLNSASPEKVEEELQLHLSPLQATATSAEQELGRAIEPQPGSVWGADRQRVDGRTARSDEETASTQQGEGEAEPPLSPLEALDGNAVSPLSMKSAVGHSGAGEVTLREEVASRGALQMPASSVRGRQLSLEGTVVGGGSPDAIRLAVPPATATPVINGVVRTAMGGVAMHSGHMHLNGPVPSKQIHVRNGMTQRQQNITVASQHLQDSHVQAMQMMITSQDLHGALKELAMKGNGVVKANGCRFCVYCKESGIVPTFHLCVHDKVVFIKGPSPAGPISRPGKRHVEAAA